MRILLAALVLAACGGAAAKHEPTPGPGPKPGPGPTPAHTTTTGVVIVDDIDCTKLVNHMVDIHAAANPAKTAANPEAVAKIRSETIKECEDKWGKTPPTDAEKASAKCSMKAQTTGELESCGS
jgi:hypothetical protein